MKIAKNMNKIKKIAILRANALGDFIFALPALYALRKTYPGSENVYLGKQWHQDFLENRKEIVDRVVVLPKAQGVGEPESYQNNKEELNNYFKKMQNEKFDLAIQMHGGGFYSNPFIKKLGAKITVGMKTTDAEDLDLTIPYFVYQNEYARYLEVVSLIKAKNIQLDPLLIINQSDIEEAERALGDKTTNYVVIHPGASDIRRRWSHKRFSLVGDFLAERGFRVIVTGVKKEKKLVERVIKTMENPAEAFIDKVSINGLTGLLSLAKLVISNDTGPLHLANAVGTKTIGLFWSGNMINAAPLFRKNNICLPSWINMCPVCGENIAQETPFQRKTGNCMHKISFINGIKTSKVVGEIQQFLRNS